jgi:hypothetical protein
MFQCSCFPWLFSRLLLWLALSTVFSSQSAGEPAKSKQRALLIRPFSHHQPASSCPLTLAAAAKSMPDSRRIPCFVPSAMRPPASMPAGTAIAGDHLLIDESSFVAPVPCQWSRQFCAECAQFSAPRAAARHWPLSRHRIRPFLDWLVN